MANKNRDKGHRLERWVANIFKELGFQNCATSRYASKKTDDEKIDLCFVGNLQIQCKAVERLGSPHTALSQMPKRAGKYNLLWHKKSHQGTVVSMYEKDFLHMYKLLIDNGIVKPEC